MKIKRHTFYDCENYLHEEEVECDSIKEYLEGSYTAIDNGYGGVIHHFDDTLSSLPFKDVFRIETRLADGTVTGAEYVGFDDSCYPKLVSSLCGIFHLFQENLFRDNLMNGLFGNYPYIGYECLWEFDQLQVKNKPVVFVREDPTDSDYLVFDFGSLDVEWLRKVEKRRLIKRISKKEFWDTKFSSRFPAMRPFKVAVKLAVKMFTKLNIPLDKLTYVMLDCEAFLMIGSIINCKVMAGISLAYEMPFLCEGRQDGYGVGFVLGAEYEKNQLCLGALRYIKHSELGMEIWGSTEEERDRNTWELMSNPDFYDELENSPKNAEIKRLREQLFITNYREKIYIKGISDDELYAIEKKRVEGSK